MTKRIPVILTVLMFVCILISTCLYENVFCQDLIQQVQHKVPGHYEQEGNSCKSLPCAKGEQIMKLNKNNARELSDQIIMLGRNPEFRFSYFQAFKFAVSYELLQDALDNKKKAYNLALVNLFAEYGIDHPDFYRELDKILEKEFKEYKIRPLGTLPELLNGRWISLQKTWEGYLKETQRFAIALVKEKYSDENKHNESN